MSRVAALRCVRGGKSVTTDHFAERFAAVRERFAAKLDSRIEEIEAAVPEFGSDGEAGMEARARAHRRAHDLCGIGPTMGFVATGKQARTVEQLLLAPIKAGRALTSAEIVRLCEEIAGLRSAARADIAPTGQE